MNKEKTLVWTIDAWKDYLYWQEHKKTLKRINRLINDILRSAYSGIVKSEALKYSLSEYWSRRIDETNRLVYVARNTKIIIISCRYHY